MNLRSLFVCVMGMSLCLAACETNTPDKSGVKDGAVVNGVFHVSADKSVCFAQGNLQYTQSSRIWSFAEQQYDYIGYDNVDGKNTTKDSQGNIYKDGSGLADKIDLFGWSAADSTWGVNVSEEQKVYQGEFADWGSCVNTGNAAGWRTLSADEWQYLLQHTRWTMAKVQGVVGLMLLPDNMTIPEGISVNIIGHSGSYQKFEESEYADNEYSVTEFSQLEIAGVVFLPCAGYRHGAIVGGAGQGGYYWSSTADGANYACGVLFQTTLMRLFSQGHRYYGRSVRLVKDM